jgi:ribosomal protein L11 methyltransferase
MTWRGPEQELRQAELILTEVLPDPVDAVSLVREDDASAEPEDASWALHAYMEQPLNADACGLLPQTLASPEVEELPEQDWVAHSLAGLGVVKAGPFLLYGSHDADKIAAREGIPLQVEANRAFGTGHHPTTAGCLEVLGDLQHLNPERVLDLGCGSGVLAMAARKLWPQSSLVATDLDAPSIDIARENAALNAIDGIEFDVAEGTASPVISAKAPYQLVLANILAGPLKELAPDLAAVTSSDGTIVLAGLLDEQEKDVRAAYVEQGFSSVTVSGTPRWPVLTLRREQKAP